LEVGLEVPSLQKAAMCSLLAARSMGTALSIGWELMQMDSVASTSGPAAHP